MNWNINSCLKCWTAPSDQKSMFLVGRVTLAWRASITARMNVAAMCLSWDKQWNGTKGIGAYLYPSYSCEDSHLSMVPVCTLDIILLNNGSILREVYLQDCMLGLRCSTLLCEEFCLPIFDETESWMLVVSHWDNVAPPAHYQTSSPFHSCHHYHDPTGSTTPALQAAQPLQRPSRVAFVSTVTTLTKHTVFTVCVTDDLLQQILVVVWNIR